MIEEFMLAANVSVAEKILKHFPLCSLLRYTVVPFCLFILRLLMLPF
jgi:exosome complex exonuclease DIS3/RRP44